MRLGPIAAAAAATILTLAGMTAPAYAAPDTPGAFCNTPGASSETASGTALTCTTTQADSVPRWREVAPVSTPTMTPKSTATPATTPKTTTTPKATVTPKTPTLTPKTTATPRPTPTKVTPVQRVTATYGCGTATFSNPLDVSVLIHYGTAQSDSLEGSIHIDAGKSQTVKSSNEAFGWTAWAEGDQTKPDVGHLWEPGKDLTCDDTTVPPGATPSPGKSGGGLANTGI